MCRYKAGKKPSFLKKKVCFWGVFKVFSETHVHVRYMSSSVRLTSAVCLSSVTFVHPTQAIEIFGNVLCHLVAWSSVTFR